MIKVSCPGKLMLFGEHAVVYGKPCIVTAVDQRINVFVKFNGKKNGKNSLLIRAPQLGINCYKKSLSELCNQDMPKEVCFIEAAVKVFNQKYKLKKGLEITTQSQFSHAYGFGSSSAITIAVIKALTLLNKILLSDKQIFDLGYKAVLAIQGVGSGFDLAAALWGRTLYFEKGAKIVGPLELSDLPLLVCNSGVKADTPTLIRQVAYLKRKYPKKINEIFKEIKKITILAKNLIQRKAWPRLGQLMNKNQKMLEKLGVSTLLLEKLIQTSLKAGAWGAKLSGAGGGDNLIVLCAKKKRQAIAKALKAQGGIIMNINLNAIGVQVESFL